ncbi:MAG: winged helix-turn-helix domain-containing protein [Acidobacteriota bacterium]
MFSEHSSLRSFGKFRLDLGRKLLWLGNEPVSLPPKAVDLLCVLVERRGELVSKEEIWHEVWDDAFVEETNLTHNIYVLRKTLKDLGEADLIKTVPRRGYRFSGVVHEIPDGELVLERPALTRTAIEIREETTSDGERQFGAQRRRLSTRAISTLAITAVVFLFAGGAFWKFGKGPADAAVPKIASIAVLPLRSFASAADNDGLRLRITDALITRLGSNTELAVRPTSAILQFVDNDSDPRELGQKLLVDAILDGRIQHEGDRLRVTIQLLSVSDGKQLWSEQFDGKDDQILNLQDAISTKILASLDAQKIQPVLSKPLTANSDAYEAYLKGRYFWRKRDEHSLRTAIGFFQQAAALDPQFSEAYSGIADAELLLYDNNIEVTPNIVSEVKETLHHALLLKPDSSDALATLGSVQMSYDWDWNGAESSLRHATEAAPNSPNAWLRYGAVLLRLRRFEEARAAFQKGLALDPLSLIANANLGMVDFCRKDFPAADAQFRKTIEIDPRFGMSHWLLSRSLWQQGKKNEAVAEILQGLDADGSSNLAQKAAQKNATATPEDVISVLLFEWRNDPERTNPHNMAYLSIYVGDKEKAIYWLQRSLKEHHPWTTWVGAAPEFDLLRGDERFKDILDGVHLSGS